MKRFAALAIVAAGIGLAGTAKADCTLSAPPAVPDGKSATEAAMVETAGAVKKFLGETEEYLACLEFEGRGKPGQSWKAKYTDAVSQMEKISSEFNQQLRTFKTR